MKDETPLEEELRALLNRRCMDTISNTPDFLLAQYLLACLEAFTMATINRDEWFGFKPFEKGSKAL